MRKSIYLLLIGCAMFALPAVAQKGKDLDALVTAMKRLQDLYTAQPVSFEVKYTYTPETDPARVLEEMQGQTVFDGRRIYNRIDSMETIINEQFRIMLFADDKIMYVTRVDSSRGADEPAGQLRAILEQAAVAACEMQESDGLASYRVTFLPEAPYKEMLVQVDSQTGYLQWIRYLVKPDMLGDEVEAGQLKPGECAVLSIRYSNFTKPANSMLLIQPGISERTEIP